MYTVLQYHNYRKEHFVRLVGVFSNEEEAEKVWINETEEHAHSKYPVDEDETFNGIKLKIVRFYDSDDESEWMIFAFQEFLCQSKVDTEYVEVLVRYSFPIWVTENSDPTVCEVIDISASSEKKANISASIEKKANISFGSIISTGEVTLVSEKDKNNKHEKWM